MWRSAKIESHQLTIVMPLCKTSKIKHSIAASLRGWIRFLESVMSLTLVTHLQAPGCSGYLDSCSELFPLNVTEE